MARRGHEVHVFSTNVDGPFDTPVCLGQPLNVEDVHVWYFKSRHFRRIYMSLTMLSALKSWMPQFDVVHIHSLFLWPTLAASRVARKARIPYVVSPRGMLVKELIGGRSRLAKSLWIKLFDRRNLESAQRIHVTTEKEAAEVNRFGFALPPLEIIPNGVEEQFVGPAADKASVRTSNGRTIAFLGRLHWIKGLDRLIHALRYAPDTHLIIAGNDDHNYQRTLERIAAACGVRERIEFSGPLYGEDKIELLRGVQLLVLPSHSENFGNVLLEAMAVGCPVVTTPEVGLADAIRSGGAGTVCVGEPETLGRCIAKMLQSPQRLKQMGERGRQMVQERYQWSVIATEMEAVYGSMSS